MLEIHTVMQKNVIDEQKDDITKGRQMNIQIVICPACLNKYNAGVVRTDEIGWKTGKLQVECPHCKMWIPEDELKEYQPKLKELLK